MYNLLWKISVLFTFIRCSTRRYTHYKWVNWCSSFHGKCSSYMYIPTSEVIRSCSVGYISLKTSNAIQSSISNNIYDWLIGLCFTPYRQYFNHITATTKGDQFLILNFPWRPSRASLLRNPVTRFLSAKGVVILNTEHYSTSHPPDIKILVKC